MPKCGLAGARVAVFICVIVLLITTTTWKGLECVTNKERGGGGWQRNVYIVCIFLRKYLMTWFVAVQWKKKKIINKFAEAAAESLRGKLCLPVKLLQ